MHFGRAGVSKMINNNVIYRVTSNGILFLIKKGNPILIDLNRHSVTNENLFKGDSIYRENVFYLYEYIIGRRCIEEQSS